MDGDYKRRLTRRTKILVSVLMYPATVLHEYSHVVAFNLFNRKASTHFETLKLDFRSKDHITLDEKSIPGNEQHRRSDFYAGVVAPCSLMLIALATTIVGVQLKMNYNYPINLIGIGVWIAGIILLAQSGPSKDDIRRFESVHGFRSRYTSLFTKSLYYIPFVVAFIMCFVHFPKLLI